MPPKGFGRSFRTELNCPAMDEDVTGRTLCDQRNGDPNESSAGSSMV